MEQRNRNTGHADPAILIENYRAALERDTSLDKARLALAEELRNDRQFDDAEQEYRIYLKRNPTDATALVGLGRNFFQRGDLDTSTEYFEAALKVDPRQPDALKELGQIDLRLGRFQKACERLQLLCEIQPYEYDVRYSWAQASSWPATTRGRRSSLRTRRVFARSKSVS